MGIGILRKGNKQTYVWDDADVEVADAADERCNSTIGLD